ncbi:hypothetical protein DE146DRAFT_789744 [Phaeosphaeria sp. MPI-PUGE-AT-0046c]|nr:hypothetical protein DE146DRAFT_789744 [Phaeosphaeria sp. MPI-PUGE-AT-0046c]
MCRKLIQVYGCGHTKVICTTACQHALDNGRQLTQNDGNNSISRSISKLSATFASPTSHGQTSAQSRSPPTHNSSTTLMSALETAPTLAHLPGQLMPTETQPNYCAYYFPHNLPKSNHPCIDCFVLPEWEQRAKRWMTWYRADHSMENPVDVERLSGIAALREEKAHEGLLNVFVDGDECAGRDV